ncbi:MAG: hypothetical protein QXU32_07780 [Nitrososphaerales archaeon]
MKVLSSVDMYLAVGVLVIALVAPSVAYGQTLYSLSMFIHDEIVESLSSSQRYERPDAFVSNNKSFKIQVVWEPTEIKPNQIVRFDIKFLNYVTNEPVHNVYYDFVVTKDEQIVKELRSSFVMNGITTHTVEFPSSGSFSVLVNVLGIGDFKVAQNEYIAFDLKVVPEFPLRTVILLGSIVGIMVALTRFAVMSKQRNGL